MLIRLGSFTKPRASRALTLPDMMRILIQTALLETSTCHKPTTSPLELTTGTALTRWKKHRFEKQRRSRKHVQSINDILRYDAFSMLAFLFAKSKC
jgi:hypothetical protein